MPRFTGSANLALIVRYDLIFLYIKTFRRVMYFMQFFVIECPKIWHY